MSDLKWDWFSCFKELCDSLNLAQLINVPTRRNLTSENKSTLLDLFLTNACHKYSSVGMFCNDVSDHFAIACVSNTKIPKAMLCSHASFFKGNQNFLNCRPFCVT